MVKTRTWIIVISALLLLSSLSALWLWLRPAGGSVANIYVEGKLVRSVDLASLTEEEIFTVETPSGVNTVSAGPDGIRVIDADCPDRVCVRSGLLTSSAPIVCLPHRLVIRLSEKAPGEPDAIAG